jgi:glycosyltransferase involved in cell wall biosynthesis
MKNCSIIIAFYNDLTLLVKILDALNCQFHGNFEVIIADDGSSKEIVNNLNLFIQKYPFRILHIWHEDMGFRKTIIMNKAVLNAKYDYLIFLDGDCIPQLHFVDDHLKNIMPGIFQSGRRVDVFRDAINHLQHTHPSRLISKHFHRFILWSLHRKAKNIERGIRLPQFLTSRLIAKNWSIVGCNFSLCKEDLLAINGFDERASVPWGAEDSDIERRLLKAGLKLKSLRHQAAVIHFDSSYEKRKKSSDSDIARLEIFREAQAENRTWTRYGILKEDRPDPVLYRSL